MAGCGVAAPPWTMLRTISLASPWLAESETRQGWQFGNVADAPEPKFGLRAQQPPGATTDWCHHTRQLAFWAASLAFPRAIPGIYGMNLAHMPELNSVWGYPTVLLVIGAVCIGAVYPVQ